MAEKLPENMVLRTVYLDPEIDQELRRLAYANNTTKNDLIRRFVRLGLGQDIDPVRGDVEPVIVADRNDKVLRVSAIGHRAGSPKSTGKAAVSKRNKPAPVKSRKKLRVR